MHLKYHYYVEFMCVAEGKSTHVIGVFAFSTKFDAFAIQSFKYYLYMERHNCLMLRTVIICC